MSSSSRATHLVRNLEESLRLLKDHPGTVPADEPLPSLLQLCQVLSAEAPEPRPIRTIHHFACTGGTLFSKCLAAMPNVVLLSEIDPLSSLFAPKGPVLPFRPTDLIYNARAALRPIDSDTVERVFQASACALHDALCDKGQYLVLRDHAHSQFCTNDDADERPTLRDILTRDHYVLSVVTVRHPLDSFLSLATQKWLNFEPATVEEYARRYAAFLARHDSVPIFRYEDMVDDPESVLQTICDHLQLPYIEGAEDFLSVIKLTGNSGRVSNEIAQRSRREVPDDLKQAIQKSDAFFRLCDRLGYRLEFD